MVHRKYIAICINCRSDKKIDNNYLDLKCTGCIGHLAGLSLRFNSPVAVIFEHNCNKLVTSGSEINFFRQAPTGD